ncbi:MAG: MlaD family protein [Acidimicrobiales bacterium]
MVALTIMMSVGLAACGGGGSGTITASAVFSDVNDLVTGAPVQYDEISVGSVKSISLDNGSARVVMQIQRSAHVPADVIAELQQTTILGQHFVALVAPANTTGSITGATGASGAPGAAGAPATLAGGPTGLLRNGAVITRTEFIPGIQQLVSTGASVFGAVNAAQLAQIVDNGAEGFGGQAASIKQLLDDFNTVLGGYASRSSEIKSVIDNFNAFNATLAPNAQSDAQSIANLAQTTSILANESTQFNQLLQSLNDLAIQGRSILDTGLGQTEDQIRALSAVATQLYEHQRDLATVIDELPAHNQALSGVVVNNFAQILEDIIVCGLPGGGAGNTADSTCNASGGGS